MAVNGAIFSYETLIHAIAGASGNVAAFALTLPLDTARVRMILDDKMKSKGSAQIIAEIVSDEGVARLYRGMSSSLKCVGVSQFIYFYIFHGLKKMVGSGNEQSAGRDLIFACAAGALNVLLTNPLWVVNSRLKMQNVNEKDQMTSTKYRGLIDGLIKIYSREGLSALWNGTSASLILISNPAIKFTAYELLKRRMNLWKSDLDPGRIFSMGVVASALATVITYPIQVLQMNSRHGHRFRHLKKSASMIEVYIYILRNFGVGYLYQGLDAKLLQSVITAGFMFLSYEKLKNLLFNLLMLGVVK